MATIQFENEQYIGTPLKSTEEELLERQLATMLTAKGSFLEELLKENPHAIRGAAQVAKNKLEANFAGMSAGDGEVGISKIRPGHILRSTGTTETPANDWRFTFTADGDYYVGYSTNNTTAVNIDKECLLLILGVMFTQGGQPVVEELRVQIGGTTYPVMVIRDAWIADNDFNVRAIPIRPLLLEPKATTLWESYSLVAGQNELVLVGLTFGLGRFLRTQAYTSVNT